MHYFKSPNKEEATLLYKELAKKLHPVKGGDPVLWEAITKEFQSLNFDKKPVEVAKVERFNIEPTDPKPVPNEVLEAAKFARTLDGCNVEILGRWVWVTGSTLKHWQTLKTKGFFYSQKKNACYYHTKEDSLRGRRRQKELPLEEIEKRHQKQLF
jgi:hypothetical protein